MITSSSIRLYPRQSRKMGSPSKFTYTVGEQEDGWILEVVDHNAASTVWDDKFATDQAALDELLRTIREEGIRTFLESSADKSLH